MSLTCIDADKSQIGFPRVSGDEPDPADTPPSQAAFSPRERG